MAADAQYVIDIAAAMPAGEQTIAQLDALQATLLASGASADVMHDAVARLANGLDSARTDALSANEALAAGKAQFKDLEAAVLQTSKAAEKAALRGVIPPDVAKQADAAEAALHAYNGELAALEARAAAAGKAVDGASTSLGNARKLQRLGATAAADAARGFGKHAESIEKLRGGLTAVGGPLGQLESGVLGPVQGFAKLAGGMGTANAAILAGVVGTVALTAAVVALGVAMVAGTIAVAAWAVGLADANRNTQLSTEAMEAMHPELTGFRDVIAEVSDATGAHTDELQEWIGNLKEAKVATADIPDALRAVALAEAALGKGGSADFFAEIKKGEVAVGDLAATTRQALGGIVARQMLGLDAQSARLKKNVGAIFGALDIEPVLSGMQTLVGIFDKTSASGQAIQFLFDEIFQPIIDKAEIAAYAVEAFVLGFLIGATKLYIALKPVIAGISEFFGFESPELADTMALITKGGEALFAVFAVGAAIVGGAFAVAIVGVALAMAPLAIAIGLVTAAVYGIVTAFTAAWSFISGIDFGAVGTAIIDGLVNGITGGAAAVISAITGVVSGAVTAAKNFLGIHSPSTLFAEMGADTTAGFAVGVDDTAPDAQSALMRMAEPPEVQSPLMRMTESPPIATGGYLAGDIAGNAAADRSAPRAERQPITGNVFNFHGVQGAEDALSRFEELATRLLEGDAAGIAGEAGA